MRALQLGDAQLVASDLQFADPGAVPVRKASPLHEELPLGVTLEWWLGQWINWFAVRADRQFCWKRGLSPSPVQNPLHFPFERRALRENREVP